VAKWDKRTRELKKKEMIRKQQARDRGEETGSDDDDDDDDDDEFDEVAAAVDWGVLEDEDSLSGTQLSTQGPFPFHVGGSESMRLAELGPSLGPVGAGGSAATLGVPAEDRWMGGGGSAATPEGRMEGAAQSPRPQRQGRRAPLPRSRG